MNGETAVRILLNAIRRIQQKHSNKEALLAHQAELEELAQANASAAKTNQSANISGVPPLQLLQPDGESVEMMTAERHSPGLGNLPATITSAETTDEISEAPTIKAMEAMEVELPHIQAPEAADAGNTSKIVVPVSGGGGARTVSSIDPSPELRERGDEEEDQDIDVLIECLEILNDATQVSPSQESMSSFGYHSACERRSSFDLDSDATDAGEEEGQQEDPEGDGSENGGGGGGGRDKDQNRAAYSWSPAATPSLDQLDPYFTPKAAPKTPKTPKSVHSE